MRKKTFAFLALLLCVLCIFCASCSGTNVNKGRKINSVNHRGYTDAPENTLSAFRLSCEMGFSMVECDVSFTKDGVPVLLHDTTVNRTSDGEGKIRDLTFEEARKLDFGSWKEERYAGERIPSFSEFLQLCQELSLYPYVEVKSGASAAEVNLLAELAQDVGIDLTWISFDYEILQQLTQIFPTGRFGYVVHFVTDYTLEKILQISAIDNYVFVDCYYLMLTRSQIERCQDLSIPVEVWTLNSERLIANVHPYVSGVTSDYLNAQNIFDKL